MAEFALHPRLAADCAVVGELGLCRLLLMNNAVFPWVILVPRSEGVREVFELSAGERGVLMEEVARVAERLQQATGAEKMNVAALGNMVPQLHVHVIARFAGDAAWPNPVWGTPGRAYGAEELAARVAEFRGVLLG